jgi:hypothetical protein
MYISVKEWARNVLNRAGIEYEYGEDGFTKMLNTYLTIRRLAKKHHRLAEYSCNGEGVVGGRFWRLDNPSAFSLDKDGCEVDVFDIESERIEAKIKALCDKVGFRVEFQGDPRGNTVKLSYNGKFVSINA